MFKILEAEKLSAAVYKQVIHAPRVAKSCEPGQFIIVRVDENAERIPLTICDYDREAGTITLAFQPIGVSTHKLVALKAGDEIADFVGPLGRPSELVTDDFEEVKKIIKQVNSTIQPEKKTLVQGPTIVGISNQNGNDVTFTVHFQVKPGKESAIRNLYLSNYIAALQKNDIKFAPTNTKPAVVTTKK